MDMIKIRKNGLACLALTLLMGVTTLNGWAQTADTKASVAPIQQKKLPPSKVVPVPDDWIVIEDKKKGFSFEVPKGTEYSTAKATNGADIMIVTLPAPSTIEMMVISFKDAKLSKDDVLKFAEGMFKTPDGKPIKFGQLTDLNDDYSLATFSRQSPKGTIIKGKVLIATDVTDNYIMVIGGEEADFKANEKVVDEIWGSFSMHSGGASGKS